MENDVILLEAAKQMNREALTKIFDLYAPILYQYALHLCSDPSMADQIVGEVFSKLLDEISFGAGPCDHLRPYLLETAYDRFVDEIHYSRHRAPLEVVNSPEQAAQSEFIGLENQMLSKTILDIIQDDLTEYQRHVIILRYMEGLSLRETAAILGKSVNIVRAAQNRAIVNLRKALAAC
jgi:RNA polymerase sigma-70 factor (ECF subfamily)